MYSCNPSTQCYIPLSYVQLCCVYSLFNRIKDREEVDQAKQLVATLQSEHTLAMQSLQATTEKEIKSLKSTHENEINSLKRTHEEALQALAQSHEQSTVSLNKGHDQSLAARARGTMTPMM